MVFGPCLTKAHTKASPVFVRELIYGNPVADISATYVDVRDVATAHVTAMQRDGLNGKRKFWGSGMVVWLQCGVSPCPGWRCCRR